jgi:hypothetical protein
MPFAHLVEAPRVMAGGISFTVNELDQGQFVFVSDAALAMLAPNARSPRERLAFVMTHIPLLTDAALAKAQRIGVPELVVIEPEDLDVLREAA